MAFVIREGDATTTGGVVVAGSSAHTIEHRQAARISDPVWCPACKSMGFIAEGNPTVIDENIAVATHGHVVKCGCSFGRNRLIASQNTVMAAEQATVNIAPDLSAKAQAATQIWAQAIREGSYHSAFTTDIPLHQVRGLTPTPECVFAKTCTIPAESTEAGTQIEPAANFGQTVVMGTAAIASSSGNATLGRVSGQAALERLGSWSVRGAVATVGSVASTLLLALWPTRMGDATLSEEQLREMMVAPTRVRFQFRRDADGIMRIYGIHTSATSGMDRVPVLNARWNADYSALEAVLDGITIVWTPNSGPVAQAPTSYPGVTEALNNILVHPVAEGTDSQIEVYPGSEDLTWQDCILVFPADSGVPPLYLVFAKPAVTPLEVDIFGAFSGRPRNGLHVDHMPSKAAIRRYLEANLVDLTQKQVDDYLNKVASVAIPAKVHQKFSETYGWRNTKVKQYLDADDLRAAVDRNFDAISPYMLEEGFAEANLEDARARMHQVNEKQGWY